MQIQEAKGELESVQGSIAIKDQRLAEEEEKLKSLQIRQSVLDELRVEFEKNNHKHKQEIVREF